MRSDDINLKVTYPVLSKYQDLCTTSDENMYIFTDIRKKDPLLISEKKTQWNQAITWLFPIKFEKYEK